MRNFDIEKIANLITTDPDVFKEPKQRRKTSGKTLSESKVQKRDKYVQFIREGNTFRPAGNVELCSTVPPAVYNAGADMGGPFMEIYTPVTDDLIFFEDSKMSAVIEEVDKFWSLKENFDKLGYLHNRGILLHGPPGTGKTCLIHQITESMVERGDLVFQTKEVYGLRAILEAFRQVEPDRALIIVLEDMDEYIGYQERDMLQLLDGSNATDNVLFLGTTNYLDKFPPRLLRPGRFDKKVHIDYPPISGRLAYLEKKLNNIEDASTIKELAENTDGFSFGHLRELVISGYAFKEDLAQTIHRLRDLDASSLPIREGKIPRLQRR